MGDKYRVVWELYSGGLSPQRIARRLKLTKACVYSRLYAARRSLGVTASESEDEAAANVPRCRCGLMLPCDRCLPSIFEVAGRRIA